MTSFRTVRHLCSSILYHSILLLLIGTPSLLGQQYTLVPTDAGPGSVLEMTWCTFLPGADSLIAHHNHELGVWKVGEHYTATGDELRFITIDSSVMTNYPRIEFANNKQRFLYYGNRGVIVDWTTWKTVALLQEITFPQFVTYTPDEREIVGIDVGRKGGADNRSRIYVWDADTGELLRSLGPNIIRIRAVAVSPDGMILLFATESGELWKLSYPDGELISTQQMFDDGVKEFRFNPAGDRLLVLHVNNSVSEWDASASTMIRKYRVSENVTDRVVSAEYRSDGAEIVTVSIQGSLRIHSTATGEIVAEVATFPDQPAEYAEYTPDGKGILTAGWRGAFIWEIRQSSSVQSNVASTTDHRFWIAPNPAHGEVTAQMDLVRPTSVEATLISMLGEEISRLEAQDYSAGSHGVRLPLTGVSPGAYWCILRTTEGRQILPVYVIQ